ncbi:MAG: hypothetical protein JNM63_02700 [Spirochaetia bacterium]|nr:hypothetical protein [Spirochaetia bacterium]
MTFSYWIYTGIGLAFTTLVMLLLHRRNRPVTNGLFYFPPTTLLFALLAINLKFSIPHIDQNTTGYLFYSLVNVVFLGILFFTVRHHKLSLAEEKRQMNLADKVIVSHILTHKDKVGPADAAYIEGSDLTPAEKKHALELLAQDPEIRFETIREKIREKSLGLNHDFDKNK